MEKDIKEDFHDKLGSLIMKYKNKIALYSYIWLKLIPGQPITKKELNELKKEFIEKGGGKITNVI